MLFHIVSGQAFFSGMLLIMMAVSLSGLRSEQCRRVWKWGVVLGLVLVSISATPLPDWYHVMLGGILGTWLGRRSAPRWISASCLFVAMIGIALESPYHLAPSKPAVPATSLTLIGDSVAAGTGGDDDSITWPNLLAATLRVQDISHMGETAGSALKRIREIHIDSNSVLLEIGGNDILGSTTSQQFHRDLEDLLREVSQHADVIYMFELPLPPFFDQYGKSQRTLARKYDVKLIPKRYFASLILNEEMTSDGIHLTQSGHTHMATLIRRLLSWEE